MRLIDADRLRAQFPEPTDWRDIEQTMFHICEIWKAIDEAPIVHESGKDARWISISEKLPAMGQHVLVPFVTGPARFVCKDGHGALEHFVGGTWLYPGSAFGDGYVVWRPYTAEDPSHPDAESVMMGVSE